MRHLFFKQSGMTILFQLQLGVGSYGFKEARLAYLSVHDKRSASSHGPKGPGSNDGEEEAAEMAVEQAKTPVKETDVDAIRKDVKVDIGTVDPGFVMASQRQRDQVDRFITELPVDIDPNSVLEAKKDIEIEYAEKDDLYKNTQKEIHSVVAQKGLTQEAARKMEEDIGMAFYKTIPMFNLDTIMKNNYDKSSYSPKNVFDKVRSAMFSAVKRNTKEGEKIDIKAVNSLARTLSEYVPKLVENQINVIKRLQRLQEVLIGINENIKRKQTEKRMLINAERSLGFPIREGVMLEGMDIKWENNYAGQGPERVKRFNKRWRVMEPEFEKTVNREGEAKIVIKDLVVRLHDTVTGSIVAIPFNNMRDFIFLHDITPVVKNKTSLKQSVPYLESMGIDLKPGMELEFDVFSRDQYSKEVYSQANKVKILSIDDKKVKFDKDVLYRAKWDSPDLADHEYKIEMTLGEFAKWLNIRHALPNLNNQELQSKLNEQYLYLNKEYLRNEKCHRAIELREGEIIYAEAPGNPMYEISKVEPGLVEVKVGPSKKQFTNVQFLRWVYENDLEPYVPELQAERAKTYLGMSPKKAEKVLADANAAIQMFKDKGIWRDSFDELKKHGNENLIPHGKEPELKTIEALDAHQHSMSAFSEFWRETKILRLDDIFKIFEHYWEFYHHHWERNQKDRYSSIGKGMPFFGADFQRLSQEAENEEIEHLKKGMKEWSPPDIYAAIFKAHNKDQLKACIDLLCEKGKFRWDDPKVWAQINHMNSPDLQIPIPEPEGTDPYQPYKEGTGMKFKGNDVAGKTGFDLLPEAIDGLWGDSTFTGWKRGNENTLDEGCKKAYNKGKELEADPRGTGGVARELAILLEKHMNGVYIEASDYEGLLRYIIEAGKAGGEDKMYYLLMGLTIPSPKTKRTIMSWDRLSYFIDQFANPFPAMDYFTEKGLKRLPGTGELFYGPWRKAHFETLTRDWAKIAKEDKNYTPPASVSDFLYKEVLTAKATQTRIDKALGKGANNIDHEDIPFFAPALKENGIETLCTPQSGGVQKISTEAYKNAYVGFGPRISALVEKFEFENQRKQAGEPSFANDFYDKLLTTLTSFMRYDSILSQRYLRDKGYMYLSRHDFTSSSVWDSTHTVGEYKTNLQGLIKDIINAYNPADKAEKFDITFEELPSTRDSKALKDRQNKIEAAVGNFGHNFEEMVSKDNGATMMKVLKEYIKNHKFVEPAGGTTPEERRKAKLRLYMSDTSASQPAATEE